MSHEKTDTNTTFNSATIYSGTDTDTRKNTKFKGREASVVNI